MVSILRRPDRVLALVLALTLGPRASLAAWPHDPAINLQINAPEGGATVARLIPDGAGGVVAVFQTDKGGSDPFPRVNLFAQRVSATGHRLWNPDDVPICVANGDQREAQLVPDGTGGVIAVWQDFRAGRLDIYAQRIDGSGTPQWTTNGIPVRTLTSTGGPLAVSDGAGGVIVAWADTAGSASNDDNVVVQRFNAAGVPQWGTSGRIFVVFAPGNQSPLGMISDGAGGAIITYRDSRDPDLNIHAVRITGSGLQLWSPGVLVSNSLHDETFSTMTTDGFGGAIVIWVDHRAAPPRLFAQHISGGGVLQWAAGGVSLARAIGGLPFPKCVSDGAGGAIVAWQDNRNGLDNIFVQRVSALGSPLWQADGMSLCADVCDQVEPDIASDGQGGALVSWTTAEASDFDVRVQRVNGDGVPLWADDGILLSTWPSVQQVSAVATDGTGGAVVAWEDGRGFYNIFGSRIDRFGNLGTTEPEIASVRDVPNDQGGKVKLAWFASYLDQASSPDIAAYDIYRSAPGSLATAAIAAGATRLSGFDRSPAPGERAFVLMPSGAQLDAWEYLATVNPVHFLDAYGYIAPTTGDSMAGSNPLTAFMVVARNGSSSKYWLSVPMAGYSVDNVAPVAPSPFAASYSSGATHLHWGANHEADLAGYRVYRGLTAGFVPDGTTLVGAPSDTGLTVAGASASWFKLSAIDVHGNESVFSTLAPQGGAVGTGDPGGGALSFSGATPNPARHETLLSFSLPAASEVSLDIYDVGGRRVRALRSGQFAAGPQSIRFDLLDDAGRRLGSGLYFAKLEVAGRSLTQRLAIVN